MLAFDACTYCAAGTSGSPISLARDTQICNFFFFFWTNHEYVICHYFFMSLYVFIKRTNVTGLSEQQRPERERERGMDALNSTKPDDHQVVSPTRVLLHLSILSINIGFTLSYHFFYKFFY